MSIEFIARRKVSNLAARGRKPRTGCNDPTLTPHSSLAYENLAEGVRSLLPRMEAFGITGAREVEIETLAQRLHTEAFQREGIIVYPATIGAWTRIR
jgi:hypothetical protein